MLTYFYPRDSRAFCVAARNAAPHAYISNAAGTNGVLIGVKAIAEAGSWHTSSSTDGSTSVRPSNVAGASDAAKAFMMFGNLAHCLVFWPAAFGRLRDEIRWFADWLEMLGTGNRQTPAGRALRRTIAAAISGVLLAGLTGVGRAEGQHVRAEDELTVTEVAPGVFAHQGQYGLFTPRNSGDVSNCGFVIGSQAVAVIDTCGSFKQGGKLLGALRARTDKPVRYVINTHMHPDHVFGNAAFEAEKPHFVGHKKLARALSARAERYLAANKELLGEDAFEGTRIVLPDTPVDDRLEIDLGERKLILMARPTAHTDNDLTVLDTQTGTAFLGDLLFSVHVPALDGSIRGWLALLDKLAAEKVARVVPGHGPPSMPWPDALKPVQRYLATVSGEVRAAIKAGRTLAATSKTAGESERNSWQLFDEFNARNVSAAFAELEWE